MKRQEQLALDRKALDADIQAAGGETPAPALSALVAAAKKEAARRYIDDAFPRDRLYAALAHADPKARKNAARLIGALENRKDAPQLITALEAETTRFVRPSMLLALGALGGKVARTYLETLPEPVADTPEEEKHAREEAEALRRARARLMEVASHPFKGFSKPQTAVLVAPAGFSSLLIQELKSHSIPADPAGEEMARVTTQDMAALYRARCFTEALFPLGEGIAADPAAVANAVREPLLNLLRDALEGLEPYPYRVECPTLENRGAFIAALAAALDTGALLNSPSQYDLELRLLPGQDGTLNAYCKLYTLDDPRFSYRRRALPASMHPATGACVARYAAGFLKKKEDLQVLDPFCGSGTLLIEWARRAPKSALTGIDIAFSALEIAKENMRAAGVRAGLVHKDCTAFVPRTPYDLILSNLPFGNRVGTHQDNERLYAKLCAMLPEWLASGGVAVLYTMEYTLLHRCLGAQKKLRRIGETRTAAGGLLPWVIVVERAE